MKGAGGDRGRGGEEGGGEINEGGGGGVDRSTQSWNGQPPSGTRENMTDPDMSWLGKMYKQSLASY